MINLPQSHISVRVPWHDNLWNGTVCLNPRENGSCLVLKNVQSKDSEKEESCAGRHFNKLGREEIPPCITEKATFMCPEQLVRWVIHPYKKTNENFQHYKYTPIKLPPYSFLAVPFRWMMKDAKKHESWTKKELSLDYESSKEPDLGFETIWVQHHENQKTLLDTFRSAVVPGKSLCLFYAKHIPLSDTKDRVLIGAGLVKSIGAILEYDYETKISDKRSYIWEHVVEHTIRGTHETGYQGGFLLPYHDLLKRCKEEGDIAFDDLVAVAPSREEFSYGTEHVSHGAVIDALHEMGAKLRKIEIVLGEDYEKYYRWIDDRISELWNMRGPYPGIGPVLRAFGIQEGNLVAWEISKKIEKESKDPAAINPWDFVDKMFKNPKSILPAPLAKKVGHTLCIAWAQLKKKQKEYLRLLSRMEINNSQAEAFFDKDTRLKAKFEQCETEDILKNPYLFYEMGRNTPCEINFASVDKGVLPNKTIQEHHPLPEPSRVDESMDERRMRALVIQTLETAAVKGHSLLPDELLMSSINEQPLEPSVNLKRHILTAIDPFLKEKLQLIRYDEEKTFYQLSRLTEMGAVIKEFVVKRHEQGKRHSIKENWRKRLDEILPAIDKSQGKEMLQREELARQEKAACLDELANARFSVLIGPAGTGKTTVLNVVCDHAEIKSGGILKLAPTGKARVRLGLDGKTVAQFLLEHKRYDPETGTHFLTDGHKYTGAKTVIVDEASMLTEDQLGALIDALEGCQRLILVGDPRQLPPIGTGRPFVDIITYIQSKQTDLQFPRVARGYAELTVICRQRKGADEAKNSADRLDVELAQRFSGQPFKEDDEDFFAKITKMRNIPELRLVQWENAHDLREKLDQALKEELNISTRECVKDFDNQLGGNFFKEAPPDFAIKSFFNLSAARCAETWQILSPVRGYGHGTKEINHAIQKEYRSPILELAYDYRAKRVPKPRGIDNVVYGDKVINVRNTRWQSWDDVYPDDKQCLRYIANGEIGIVIGKYRGKFEKWSGELPTEIVFSSQPNHSYKFKKRHFKEEGESTLELAYAITVHKSQGSGFKTVFLILPNPCHLLSRELIYTAFTRQEDRIVILHQGDFHDLKKYVSAQFSETARRITNLMQAPEIREVEKKFYDNRYINMSTAGEWMISKSEVIIADLLFVNKIKYSYESRLVHPDGTYCHPDFTIVDDDRGITYYWEHFGLLHKEDYQRKAERKLKWYESMGIIPYDRARDENDRLLIITRDKPDGGIDARQISKIIEKVIKGE